MQAGETLDYTMYTHYTSDDLLPHDWSLVAWASQSPVRIDYVNEDGTRNLQKSSTVFMVQNINASEDHAYGLSVIVSLATLMAILN